ncbi:MAG: hypothetical protein E7813_02980 [Bradyrhizobium sp.]|uniref:O-linked N-acetylglucosamine transferase, SPINDLY family protein n=1 Tax=Bradyrhizobium sp. TaxID=376 RepID=UPI00120AE775|nr:hypothetical protein [Bradyrhizobium sp.]THD73561.1 MAG: hypothetical protein E7813_02980 [Bradyrhizobium sp.]
MPVTPEPIQDLTALCAAGHYAELERKARVLVRTAQASAIVGQLLRTAAAATNRHQEALATRQTAAACLEPAAAIGIHVDPAAAYFIGGMLLVAAGELSRGEVSLRRAIALDPSNPAPYAYLGRLLGRIGRLREAVAAARHAVELIGAASSAVDADDADTLDAAAMVFGAAGHVHTALEIFRMTRGYEKDLECAFAALLAARTCCDWELSELIQASIRQADPPWSSQQASPFTVLLMEGTTRNEQLNVARSYAESVSWSAIPAGRRAAEHQAAKPRMRIGYLSGDFFNHAVAHLAVGVIEAHDRSRFEFIGYDYSPRRDDEYRRRLALGFDRMVSICDLDDTAAAQRIAGDDCDIVVDLKGWTAGTRSRILAARPAPVQVQWLGYPGTMGAPWIDYIIADRTLVRPGEEVHFSEKVVRLPDTYQPYDDRRRIGPPPPRAACGLPEGALVFCSFNHSFKITRSVFDVWMTLLRATGDSVLWLLHLNPEIDAALKRHAIAGGVATERLIFAPFASRAEHLARLGQADLALDCFPYGSHTTASDVLTAGVPLVALSGDTFASRVSASVLTAAGLSGLVTTSLDGYLDLASRLATDRNALARLRVAACGRTAPLFDTARFTRNLEAAFTAINARRLAALPPDHIGIT